MSSKKNSQGRKSKGRSKSRKKSGLPTYVLILGAVVAAVAVVGALVLMDLGAGGSKAQAEGVSLDKSTGAQDAPVVVVEYADFQCPYCGKFATGPARQLKDDYVDSGQVRLVFRHLAFLGNESAWAAEAAECANEQGRFWDYHDKLFAEQRGENQGAFAQDKLKRFAAELELDQAQFDECLDSGEYRSKVRDESREAQRRRINSTPSVLVNGVYVEGGSSYQVLQAAIEAELRNK